MSNGRQVQVNGVVGVWCASKYFTIKCDARVDILQEPLPLDHVGVLKRKPPVDAGFVPLVDLVDIPARAFLPTVLRKEVFLRLHHIDSGNVIGSSHIQELHPFLVDVFKLSVLVVVELRTCISEIVLYLARILLKGFTF